MDYDISNDPRLKSAIEQAMQMCKPQLDRIAKLVKDIAEERRRLAEERRRLSEYQQTMIAALNQLTLQLKASEPAETRTIQ